MSLTCSHHLLIKVQEEEEEEEEEEYKRSMKRKQYIAIIKNECRFPSFDDTIISSHQRFLAVRL
jgi:hypothetical protein